MGEGEGGEVWVSGTGNGIDNDCGTVMYDIS